MRLTNPRTSSVRRWAAASPAAIPRSIGGRSSHRRFHVISDAMVQIVSGRAASAIEATSFVSFSSWCSTISPARAATSVNVHSWAGRASSGPKVAILSSEVRNSPRGSMSVRS